VEAGESMTPLRAFSFVFIWAGVVVFAIGAVLRSRSQRQA
jgi:EamA domain-containing membrane protein RarD